MLIEAWDKDGSLLAEAFYSDFSIGMDSYRSERAHIVEYCITVPWDDVTILKIADSIIIIKHCCSGLLTDPCYSLNVGGFSGMEGVDDAFSNDGIAFTIGCGSGWWRGDDNENE